MSILKIYIHPNEILRKISQKVTKEEVLQPKFQQLISDMAETMVKKDGIGLAGPQVGQSVRLIAVNTKDGVLALVNPVITNHSLRKEWGEEGCLSLPNTFGQVKRYKKVHCKFIDEKGNNRKIEAGGLMARVIQHEIDHLDGILFIDKAKEIVTE